MSLLGSVEAVKSLLQRKKYQGQTFSEKIISRAEKHYDSIKPVAGFWIYTDEQKKARQEIQKAFRDAGLVCPNY